MVKRILIIGTGCSGLHTLLAFKQSLNSEEYKYVAYERSDVVGGLWNYSEDVGIDSYDGFPVHSAMYKQLKTNSARCTIELPFTDFYKKDEPTFTTYERFCQSLNQLADEYDLKNFIEFRHYVKHLVKFENRFKVEVINTETKETFEEFFDYVVVASGRFNVPKWPEPDHDLLKKFEGKYIHSKDFKDPALYKGKKVLCIGGSFSGLDISLLLSKNGAEKTILYCKPTALLVQLCKFKWNDSFYYIQDPITNVEKNVVTFESGKAEEFDVIIACTGYKCEFPFLSPDLHPDSKLPFFPHLYDGIVSINNPQLMFVGAVAYFLVKMMTYTQGHYVTMLLNSHFESLPTNEEMENSLTELYNKAALLRTIDDVTQFQFDYYYYLQDHCGRKCLDNRHLTILQDVVAAVMSGDDLGNFTINLPEE